MASADILDSGEFREVAMASSPGRPTTPSSDSDTRLAALLVASAGGDELAFADFYDATNAHVYGVVRRVLRAADHAAEVTQELYVEVWLGAGRYDRSRGSVLGWITMLAHRRAVDRVRSVSSSTARDDRYAREAGGWPFDQVWHEVERAIDHRRVRRAVEALAPSLREVVTLTYFGGFTHRQTAELLQLPLGTVKTRVRAGLGRLRAWCAPGVE